MQKLFLGAAFILLFQLSALAQSDTTEVTVKIIKTTQDDSLILDASGKKWVKAPGFTKPRNVTTTWFDHFDIGFSNFKDHTNYGSADMQAYAPGGNAGWFDLKNGKSINFNLWIFNQKVNLINHAVNLKYALGLELNNYRFKNDIRFNKNAPYVYPDNTVNRTYSKDKLAADYITLPLMLNFNFGAPKNMSYQKTIGHKGNIKVKARTTRDFGFSAGLSAGYLYTARNKFINTDEGKQKLKDNFGLNTWKVAYIAELNLGYFSLYGSYAVKSMFKNGPDFTPYTVGLRF